MIDDYKALIDNKTLPNKASRGGWSPPSQSLPRYNSGGNYSVQPSGEVDDAALQLKRLRAIQSGDMNGYDNLLQQHGQQIQKTGRDPGSSGFYPGQKK